MNRLTKKFLKILLMAMATIIASGSFPALAQNSISLTTYFPEPVASVERIRLIPDDPNVGGCDIGTMYTLKDDGHIQYCRDINGDNIGEWGELIGIWTQNEDSVYLTDPSESNEDIKIGIGTEDSTDLPSRLTLGFGATTPDGGILAIGTHGQGALLPDGGTGLGPRFIWYPRKSALRAGRLTTDASFWGDASIGEYSIGLGKDALASGQNSIAFHGQATALNSVAMGDFSQATAEEAFAIGVRTTASANYAFALGENAEASGLYGVAIGGKALFEGIHTSAFGNNSLAVGGGIAGNNTDPTIGEHSIAIGHGAGTMGTQSIAIGEGAAAVDNFSVALGLGAAGVSELPGSHDPTTAEYSIAVGTRAIAHGTESIALGLDAESFAHQSLAIGFDAEVGIDGNPASYGHYSIDFGNDNLRVEGNSSMGFGLDNTNYVLTQDHTFTIMGGNVGIGVAEAPAAKLHLSGEDNSSGDTSPKSPEIMFSDEDIGTGFDDSSWPQYDSPVTGRIGSLSQPAASGGIGMSGVSSTTASLNNTPGFLLASIITQSAALGRTPAIDINGFVSNGAGGYTTAASNDKVFQVLSNAPLPAYASDVFGNGNVNISASMGTTTAPQALNIFHTFKLRPRATAPAVCNGTNFENDKGVIYMRANDPNPKTFCYCDGNAWHTVSGPGPCN